MNDIFNLDRFENYLKRSLNLHKTLYLYLLAIVGGGYIVSVLLQLSWGFSFLKLIKVILPVFIVFCPCFLEKPINKYNGVFEYTFPVSTFERFFIYLLRYVIFLPLLVFGTYYLLTFVCSLIPVEQMQTYAQAASYGSWGIPFSYLSPAIISSQSIFLLGYLSFRRHSFIKTWLALFAGIFIFSTCMLMFIGYILPIGYLILNPSVIFQNLEGINMKLFGAIGNLLDPILGYILKYTFSFVIWIVCYYKIRDKEI